jgi:lysophospholipase L1-like esterase
MSRVDADPSAEANAAKVALPANLRRRVRLAAIVLVAVFLVAGAVAYRHFWLSRPIGQGPAGPTVPREPFQRPWSDRKVLLVGLGDSVTAGFGVGEAHSYVGRLAQNPEDEWPDMSGVCLRAVLPNLRVLNLAVSGSTSLQHEETIASRLQRQPSDVFGLVVMTTGGNDLIHNYGRTPPREGAMYGASLEQALPWVRAFEKRLDHMVDLISDRFPGGCHVFLGDIYDPTDGLGDAPNAGLPTWPDGLEIVGAYNAILHECAARRANVRAVPIRDGFLGHGIHCRQFWRETYCSADPTYWYGANLEDPNDSGYDALRRMFLIEIAKAAQAMFRGQ